MEYFIALTKIHRYIPESDLGALSHLIQNSMYVTTVSNTFQPLIFFYHEELHLRYCIGLEYCSMIQKNSKRHWGQLPPHDRGQSW